MHNLEDGPVQFEVVFDDGDKAIGDDGDVNLYPHAILAIAPETLDAEVLFDPFEKQFDLPAVTVQQGDVLCRKVEVVGIVHEGTSEVCGVIDNSAQYSRVVAGVALPRESDGLVEEHAVLPVKHTFSVENLEFRFSFLPDDEECTTEMDSEEPCKVEVATVEDVAGIGFVLNPVHRLAVVDFGMGDSIEYGYLGDDVNLSVDFDAGFCAAEECPTKESKLITSFSVGGCDICEFSECATPKKLPEDEDKQVVSMRKSPVLSSVVEFVYNPAKLPLWQIHCDLGEYVSSVVHLCFFLLKTKVRNSSPGQYFSVIKQCA